MYLDFTDTCHYDLLQGGPFPFLIDFKLPNLSLGVLTPQSLLMLIKIDLFFFFKKNKTK
jgi:hypothetical protein